MSEQPKTRKHISFEETTHRYTNTLTNEVYTSGTTFIGKFHKKFNALEVATKLVNTNLKYKGRTVEGIIAEWDEAGAMGTRIHKYLEDHLNKVLDLGKLPSNHTTRVKQLIEAWDGLCLIDIYKEWEIVPEMILYLDEHKLAGQSDLVLLNHREKKFKVLDYKTNKKGVSREAYKNETMFAPVEHLPECKFSHYSLQLSLYSFMLEQEIGYTCVGNEILWVDTNDKDKVEIHQWETPYFREEVQEMLEVFSESR